MWKLVIAMMMVVGVYADELQSDSMWYFQRGCAGLFAGEAGTAAEEFGSAMWALDRNYESAEGVWFVVKFAQIVTYDALGQRDECLKSLGAFVLAANGIEEEEDEDIFEEEEIDFLFRKLAMMAPSDDVRELLLDLLED